MRSISKNAFRRPGRRRKAPRAVTLERRKIMQIKVNKDFLTEYKDEFWKGFSVQEAISIATASGIVAGMVFVLHRQFGISPANAVYLGVPAAMPVLAVGFYKYQGYMSLPELIRQIYFTYKCRELVFGAGERKEPFGHFFFLKRRKGRK